jgi:hypothetical protein
MGMDVYDRHHDLVSLVDVDLPMKDRMSSYITHQSAGLALNGPEGSRQARPLSEVFLPRPSPAGAAVHDPFRHFAATICCGAQLPDSYSLLSGGNTRKAVTGIYSVNLLRGQP